MCNQKNLLEPDCKEEGIFTIIKAKSFQNAQTFVKKRLQGGGNEVEIVKELERAEKLMLNYVEENPKEPAKISVKICKGNFCISFTFLRKIDLDILIEF